MNIPSSIGVAIQGSAGCRMGQTKGAHRRDSIVLIDGYGFTLCPVYARRVISFSEITLRRQPGSHQASSSEGCPVKIGSTHLSTQKIRPSQ